MKEEFFKIVKFTLIMAVIILIIVGCCLFEKKYVCDNVATKTELLLLLSDHYDPKTYEQMDLKSIDVLMDHIILNLHKNIINLEVNKTRL